MRRLRRVAGPAEVVGIVKDTGVRCTDGSPVRTLKATGGNVAGREFVVDPKGRWRWRDTGEPIGAGRAVDGIQLAE